MSSRKRSSIKRKNSPTNDTFSTDESNPSSSKRKKQPDTEKRLRRYRATMTVGIYDRIERALNQRLYLLAITKSSNESFSREYKVLGQTANVYTVVISHLPSCTCPDYAKGHLCKHIIFVLHRVLKVSRHSPLIYQQALLTSELNEIFTKADVQTNDSSILAEQPIRDAYQAKTGDPDVILTVTTIEQKPITNDDECPICFESMINEKTNILFCSTSCGNNMHKNCFDKWRQAKLSMSEPVTCPFCRVEWKTNKEKSHHHHQHLLNSRGYLNLAAYSTTDDYDEELDDLYFNYW
jgi:hypothetical protein